MGLRLTFISFACILAAACQWTPSDNGASSPTDEPPTPAPLLAPAPMGETWSPAAEEPLVVLAAPTDEEPLELLPDIEELGDNQGLEATPERIALGRMLFHDTRLSKNHTVSCATCHDLRFAGIDRTQRAVGIHSQVGPVNTPTVFNAALAVAQFWDGRAHNLQQQAGGPPEAAGEMGSSLPEIVARLKQDEAYVTAFGKAFPDQVDDAEDIDRDLILEAIATFELTLVTPDSSFDRWLGGNLKALDERQLRGYAVFKHIGCSECHYGPAVGGKTFQKMGAKKDFFSDRTITHADLGRFNVTKDERDKHFFKVPTLRNVAATQPYFHDGTVASLEEAVVLMARHQLGLELDDTDTGDIVAFLQSLTGTYQGRPLLPTQK